MAGIGFELKRLFARKGILSTIRAYGYAGIVCTGPMLLGVTLLLGVMYLSQWAGSEKHERELLVSMITYCLLFSLILTSLFSMITTRYIADMIYIKENKSILPSFYGSLGIMLAVGGLGYGTFLFFSGITLSYQILSLLLFLALTVTWTEINYLTAIKDYGSILKVFAVSLIVAFLTGYGLIRFSPLTPTVALLVAVNSGYGVMAVWYFNLLYRYFPEGKGSSLSFLRWVDRYPRLAWVGVFVTLGMFGHLLIMWGSPLSVQIQGLFYGAPEYDVAALVAFFSILISTVTFVTSVEVRFYPQYRNYFSLFNDGGCIGDIERAENNMLRVLREELGYLEQKQVFTTLLFIVIGSQVLAVLPLGFTDNMLGIYRVLCLGYTLYAIGNSFMLILLYFADNKGAFIVSFVFVFFTNLFTFLLRSTSNIFYGFGFVLGSLFFCIAAYIRLYRYISKLKYHVLSEQPVFAKEPDGIFTKLCNVLDNRLDRKQKSQEKSQQKKVYTSDE